MNTFIVFVGFLAAVGLLAAVGAYPSQHIVGGHDSVRGKWPAMISLFYRHRPDYFGHLCGGSLLNENWVITAGHCIYGNENLNDYKVKLGGFDLEEDDFQQVLDVEKFVFHPQFGPHIPGLPYDMVLLKLNGTADLSNQYISTIKLPAPDMEMAGNKNCYIMGWGRTGNDRNNPQRPTKLQETLIPVITNPVCKKYYGLIDFLTPIGPTHICVGRPDLDKRSACMGDSGGPLVCDMGENDWRLSGVLSRSANLECENYPSVYMRVTAFLDWLREHVPNI